MNSSNLMYHDVVLTDDPSESGFTIAGASRYKFTASDFSGHLQRISATIQMKAKPVYDVINNVGGNDNFMITFDDGGKSAKSIIVPLLESLGWKGHFFISTDFIGKNGFLTANDIIDIYKMGHIIGSHSCSHPLKMSSLSKKEIEYEWTKSMDILSGLLNVRIDAASVPGGFTSPAVVEAAEKAGYKFLFNSEPVKNIKKINNIYVLGRYTMFNYLQAPAAAALANGDIIECMRQYLYWNLKKTAKKYAGGIYRKIRERSIG